VAYDKKYSPTATGSPSGNPGDQTRPAVLVVDDHADFRQSLCQSIQLHGHRVIEASTGDEALDVMTDVPVSAIVTDIAMPGLNGVELIRQVRKRATHTDPRIIVMSGQDKLTGEVKNALTALGVAAFLKKPFQMNELVQALSGV
jgi:DNA-binding response OmpR family regulator